MTLEERARQGQQDGPGPSQWPASPVNVIARQDCPGQRQIARGSGHACPVEQSPAGPSTPIGGKTDISGVACSPPIATASSSGLQVAESPRGRQAGGGPPARSRRAEVDAFAARRELAENTPPQRCRFSRQLVDLLLVRHSMVELGWSTWRWKACNRACQVARPYLGRLKV
jgi:hypothetical protein